MNKGKKRKAKINMRGSFHFPLKYITDTPEEDLYLTCVVQYIISFVSWKQPHLSGGTRDKFSQSCTGRADLSCLSWKPDQGLSDVWNESCTQTGESISPWHSFGIPEEKKMCLRYFSYSTCALHCEKFSLVSFQATLRCSSRLGWNFCGEPHVTISINSFKHLQFLAWKMP